MTTLVRSIHFQCLKQDEASSRNGYGQSYRLDAYVSGPIDAATGMVINLKDLDQILKGVVDQVAGKHLSLPATQENLVRILYQRLKERFLQSSVRLVKARLYESDDLWVDESDE